MPPVVKNQRFVYRYFIFVVFACCFVFGCNSPDSATENNSDSIAVVPSADTSQTSTSVKAIDLHMDILYIEEGTFRTLQTGSNRKLILTFRVVEPSKGSLTLIARSSKQHKFDANAITLKNGDKSQTNYTDEEISFANLKVYKRDFEKIVSNFRTPEDNEIVVFYPMKPGIESWNIYYDIHILPNMQTFKQLTFPLNKENREKYYVARTNPSPPASSDPDDFD